MVFLLSHENDFSCSRWISLRFLLFYRKDVQLLFSALWDIPLWEGKCWQLFHTGITTEVCKKRLSASDTDAKYFGASYQSAAI